jgi:hypothetical protein
MGFAQTTSDPCLYISTEGEMFIIAVYVDDIVLDGKNDRELSEVKKAFSAQLRPGSSNGRRSSGLIEFMNMFLW